MAGEHSWIWRAAVIVGLPLATFSVAAVVADLQIATLLLVALGLASVVPLICLIRGDATEKQRRLFDSIENHPLARTESADLARRFFEAMSGQSLLTSPGFVVPVGFLTILVFLFALAGLFGATFDSLLATPNLFLGGVLLDNGTTVRDYQEGTMLMITSAAFGAYVIVSLRLVRRVNNFDIDPISFYFFSIHLLQAVVVAVVLRHMLELFELEASLGLLAATGFAVGLQPDIFMSLIARFVRERFNLSGSSQVEPDAALRPTNFSLAMIEGLTKEKRARLEEMGIDNSQVLAEYNPFVLWARTAYQLQHVIDWTAQAQLYVLVKEAGLNQLRPWGVRDVFSFEEAATGAAGQALAGRLNIPPAVLDAVIETLHADSSWTRLVQVRNVLVGRSEPGSPSATPAAPSISAAETGFRRLPSV